MEFVDALLVGGDVGRGVVERAVALADDGGSCRRASGRRGRTRRAPLRWVGRCRRVPVARRAARVVVEKTLAELVVEMHVQARVDFVEFGAGKIDAPLPDGEVFRVAGLELGEFGAAGVGHRRAGHRKIWPPDRCVPVPSPRFVLPSLGLAC